MLVYLSGFIMLAVGYAFFAEGLFTAFTMCVNVFLAGLIAFQFFEPLAAWLAPQFAGTFALGYEDFLGIIVIFWITLGCLRLVTNHIANRQIAIHPKADCLAGGFFGLLTGYFISGILVCALQTLPWHENFMSFEYRLDPSQKLRRYLPPDRVWLALMQRGSTGTFSRKGGEAFDVNSSFELRYARYRRYNDARDPSVDGLVPYNGEYDRAAEK